MEKNKLSPEKITKPIQLLGAWLVGLLAVDGAFLTAATNMEITSWQSGALTIGAILNVPLFIGALFLLQTKFRPELQEDSYYSTYLNNKTNEVMRISKADLNYEHVVSRIESIETKLKVIEKPTKNLDDNNELAQLTLKNLSYATNRYLEPDIDRRVEDKLDELGIGIIRLFGKEEDKPEKLVVAIAEHLPRPIQNEILLMAQELGFEYYSYIEPFEEIEEDVLLGAYGDPQGKISVKIAKRA
ncbi:hypothetical protein WNY77_00290 [Paraglaciecola mesophila]|uniref:Uncharacterized protein n=1 Tax=Paraglaciecola mesophila TaxID=197222 RepID=A0ABU9SQR6_9ALTE